MDSDKDDRWPCACVKRNRKGDMTHIKLHVSDTLQCKKCGAIKPGASYYKCSRCGKIMLRESTKAWVKSYCGTTGCTTHIHKTTPAT